MAIKYRELIEKSAAFGRLKRDADGGRISAAYALISPDRAALTLLASLFIARAVSGGKGGIKEQRALDGSYLDVVVLPRKEGDKPVPKLRAEDVEYLLDTAYLTPAELDAKYYVLAPEEPIAELLQNKLLKTLEDPPEHARFILLAGNENQLLPTVISRCSVVRLDEFPEADIEAELRRYSADEAAVALAAASCRGQIGLAERMAGDKKYRYLYELAFQVLKYMKRSPEILHQAGLVSVYKDDLNEFVDFLEIILRDVLVEGCGKPELIGMRSSVTDILALSREYPPETVLKILPVLQRTRARMKLNGNANSMIDELLFSILEVKAKCQK